MRCPRLITLLPLSLSLAFCACGANKASQRQEEDDKWEGTWGSDDGAGGRADRHFLKKKQQDASPPPASAAPVPGQAKEPALSDDWGVDLIADGPGAPQPRPQPARTVAKPEPEPKPEPKSVPTPKAAAELPVDELTVEEAPREELSGGWEIEPAPVPRPPQERAPAPPPAASDPQPAPGGQASPSSKAVAAGTPAAKPTPSAGGGSAGGVQGQPDLLIDLKGGLALERGMRTQPLAGLGLGWNLGKFLGWPGLYLRADVDTFVGKSPLGSEYVLVDPALGFQGRFALGPVNLSVLLEFALRNMIVTKSSSTSSRDPDLGLGVRGGLLLDLPLTDFFSLQVGADGRYMKDPLSGNFEVSAVFAGGVGFIF